MKKLFISTLFLFISFIPSFSQSDLLQFPKDAAILKEDGSFEVITNEDANFTPIGFFVIADGLHAQTRTSAAPQTKVILKVNSMNESLSENIKVFKMKANKSSRRASLGGYGIKSKAVVPFSLDKYDENCVVIILKNLEPGEYGIWYTNPLEFSGGMHKMTFFGVE